MLYRSLFPRDLWAEMERLQREATPHTPELSPSIRGLGRGGYPAINVGTTPESVEIYAFAPGLEPDAIEVLLDKGVLTIAGERRIQVPGRDDPATLHIDERFGGRFHRVINLPDDIDPNEIGATYRDGVLHLSIRRRVASQPRRIAVQ
ncbi:MAG: hypothetical protein RJA44_1951 [Pseudomonadota bacterium]|jgi:HSP20 family protein